MSLPVGVTTRTLTIGRPFDALGNYATLTISVAPVFGGTAQRLVWSATGETFEVLPVKPPAQTDPDGDTTETIDLPIVDQSGWLDGSGNAITGWSYQVSVTPTFIVGAVKTKMKTYTKFVSPKSTDSSPIDMDKLPDGSTAAPVLGPSSYITSGDLAAALATVSGNANNVLNLGLKGDVVTVTDAAITSGQATLSSTSAAFTSAHVGKVAHVVGAGAVYPDRGAWAPSTAYAFGDRVSYLGDTYYANAAITSGTTFAVGNWMKAPATSQTLMATISSVSGGVATLSATAATTVTGATCHFGTDDSTAANALGSGSFTFPGGRTYFLADYYLPSHTSLTFEPGATFRLPSYPSTDVAVFRLLTSDRTSTTQLQDIHLRGEAILDASELTPPSGTIPRGVHVLNVRDWSIEALVGVGLPGATGNTLVVGANQALTGPSNGRVGSVRSMNVRGLGSSAVQHTGGVDIDYGNLITDGGVAFRVETDGNATFTENITCRLAHATNESKFGNSAVYLVAHNHTIRNVAVDNLLAEGGCDGVTMSTSGGTLEDCSIRRGRVVGGGRGVNTQGNTQAFPGVTVSDMRCDGALAQPALRSVAGSLGGVGFAVVPGMTLRNCRATNCADRGFYDMNPGTGIAAGTHATLIGCEATSNTGSAFAFRGIAKVAMFGGLATDAVAGTASISAQMLGSTQSSGTLSGWMVHSGASSVSGSGGVLTVTASGTDTAATARTATGTSGIPVTANHYYKFSAAGAVGTAPAGSTIVVSLWFYKSDGSVSSSPNGSASVAMPTTGVWYAQAPSDAAYVACVVKFFSNVVGQTLTAGWTATFSSLTLQEVTGIATQTYGIDASSGVAVDYYGTDLTGNSAGATTGAGTITSH